LLPTIAAYRMVSADMTRSLERAAAVPQVERESAYYLTNIEKVKSIDDFLADDRLYSFAMKAFGLSDMTYAKAFMRKVLEGGIDSNDSFANQLSDPRYRDFANTFNFVDFGDTTTVFTRTRQGTVDKYVRQSLEESAGADNEGVRLALYFQRKAASIDSPYAILADPALLKVVQTALRIPPETGTQDIDKQAALISKRLDIADLQDPQKLDAFLTRFASLWDVDNPQTTATSPALVLIARPTEAGIGADLLLSLQNLKLGGS
jgi:Protein of unknown function (DUF1217)